MAGDRLPFGYSFDRLTELAKLCTDLHYSRYLPAGDAADAAALGVIEALYSAASKPTERDLLSAGSDAISAAVRTEQRHRGQGRGHDSAPPVNTVIYWGNTRPPDEAPWVEALLDRLAVSEVWRDLAERHQAVLMALADAGTYAAAAGTLNTTVGSFTVRLSAARRAARRLWFAPEPAPAHKIRDHRGYDTERSPTAPWRYRRNKVRRAS